MRYNTFYQVHKALRAMLYDTATELQRTDFNNEKEVTSLLANITTVVDVFDKHAYNEDHFVFSAVEQYEPSVVDAFEQEHVRDHELSTQLRTLVNIYRSLETDEERIELGSALRKAFVDFLAFNLVHMAKEEDIINNLLWRYYTDEQIRALEKQIISNQTPESIAVVWKWMIRGLSNTEIINWLKAVEKNASQVVFKNLFLTAEKELPGNRFRQVIDELQKAA
jgi:hemerythrin HHE cation binding domain-containing protein